MRITITSEDYTIPDDKEAFFLRLPDEEDNALIPEQKEGPMFDIELSDNLINDIINLYLPTVTKLNGDRFAELKIGNFREKDLKPVFTRDLYGTNLYMGKVDAPISAEALSDRGWGQRLQFYAEEVYYELYDYKINGIGICWNITEQLKEHPEIKQLLEINKYEQ